MKDAFERQMVVGLPLDKAWAYLQDVRALAACSSYLQGVEVIEEGHRWSTVLQDRVGPFKLAAPMAVEIAAETADFQWFGKRCSERPSSCCAMAWTI